MEVTNKIGTYVYCVCKVVSEDGCMFLEILFLAYFIELWPLNSTALMTSCGALGLC